MIDKNKVQFLLADLKPELFRFRRTLHAHPELSFQEANTSLFVQSILNSWNIEFTTGWATHGIVGIIKGDLESDRTVALRADMDALPIQENNELEWKSKENGIMHACGHDVHMTCLLGALFLLNSLRSDWGGTVKFIFQPGEEKLPGGASIMIDQKVLESPMPDVIIGQHVQPNMDVGHVGICPLKAMASCDEIYLTIKGVGGHAAMPLLAINPISVASELVLELNQLLVNFNPNKVPSVLSIGKFTTEGGATNIIPERVHIEGTFRCMDEDFRKYVHCLIEKICLDISLKYKAHCSLNIQKGYPCLMNDLDYYHAFLKVAKNYLGEANVEILQPRMTSEDFAYYSQQIPAIFYRLGTGQSSNVHTSQFTVNEESILIGAGLMATLASTILRNT
ncbi:MAG: M20 family metallopeptidase [Saprospiraceae bacterium]